MSNLALAFRFARRELRSGLSGFRVFLACITLGVAAIAGVGSLGEAFLTGMSEQGRVLLGGDMSLRRQYRPASEDELDFMRRYGNVSVNVGMRSMASAPNGTRTVVELKAVDDAYPMVGAVVFEPQMSMAEALSCNDTVCGVAVEDALLARLGVQLGAVLRIGEADYQIRARTISEPDRITGGFTLGPRVMLSEAALRRSGLVVEGSMIGYSYDIAFAQPVKTNDFEDALNAEFPEAGFRLRDTENAMPDVSRFIRQATMFLSLVGLTALVIGGVGAGQAINAFIDKRRGAIAIMKAVGADGSLIFLTYLILVMIIATIGLVLGLGLGAALPFVVGYFFGADIPAPANYAVYSGPLIMAAAFGILTALAFAILPLARAREINAAALFRDLISPSSARGRWPYRIAATIAFAAIVILSVTLSRYTNFTLGFLGGSAAILIALRFAGQGLKYLIARLPHGGSQVVRLAFGNLTRPGTQSVQVIVALGLGLSLLAVVTLTENSVQSEIADQLPDRAPSFFFVDVQKADVDAFTKTVIATPTTAEFNATPMLRARIVKIKGVPVEDVRKGPFGRGIPDGDRGLSYARKKPKNVTIVEGPEWWPDTYEGEELVSLEADDAKDMGLAIGDTITVNVLGRDIDARIFNLQDIDFRDGGIDFFMIMSPGIVAQAPHTYVATVRVGLEQETALFDAVSKAFPNVTIVNVRTTLVQVGEMLGMLATAMTAAGMITILAGILVLSGAIAAGHRARMYEAVVLKVLGATRGRLAAIYAIEYGLLGALAGLAAFVAGSVAAWAITTFVLEIPLAFSLRAVAVTILCGAAGTLILGLIGGFAALSAKPAARLRNP